MYSTSQPLALTTVRSQIRAMLQKLGVHLRGNAILDARSQLAVVALASRHRELLPYDPGAPRDRRRPTPTERECRPTSARTA